MTTSTRQDSAARARSLFGLLLALPLAALIAGIFACLPVPLGDPENSKIDAKLTGGWIVATSDTASTLYIVRAYDARTYLIESLEFEVNADKSIKPGKCMAMKGWLTTLGEKRFICAEPLNPNEPIGLDAAEEKKVYFVAAVTTKGDQIELATLDIPEATLKEIKTSADAEKVLKANLDNPKFYTDKPTVLKKVGKDQADTVNAVLKAFYMN